MKYGLQLYSIRDITQNDLASAIKKTAELGYNCVEFAGFFGHTADEINSMLADSGLEISGTHSSFDDLVNNYEETVAYHKAIGNRHYIIPGYDISDQSKLDYFIDNINILYEKLKADGIELSYHNHASEFIPNKDGSVPFEQLFYRTGITFEIDTYWAFVGMKEPLLLLDRVKDRVTFIHIKDGTPDGHGFPLGMGSAPVADVYDYAVKNNIPMVVESETCIPDGITEAKICIDYLKSLESSKR